MPGLAARLGYTTRHVSRVLRDELGAGPLARARAHRAQTARSLLAATGRDAVGYRLDICLRESATLLRCANGPG